MLIFKKLGTMIHTIGMMSIGGFLVYIFMSSSFTSPNIMSEITALKDSFTGSLSLFDTLPEQVNIMLDDINSLPDNMQQIRDNIDEMKN